MFFSDVVSEKAGHAGAGGAAMDAHLHFAGGRCGEFRIAIVPAAARTVACNFLGAEDESEIRDEQVGEVVCELANMICGSVLSRLNGDLAFDLSHPELLPGVGDGNGWPETAARTFELENGWLTTAIRFEELCRD
jgi:hypothetical protein